MTTETHTEDVNTTLFLATNAVAIASMFGTYFALQTATAPYFKMQETKRKLKRAKFHAELAIESARANKTMEKRQSDFLAQVREARNTIH